MSYPAGALRLLANLGCGENSESPPKVGNGPCHQCIGGNLFLRSEPLRLKSTRTYWARRRKNKQQTKKTENMKQQGERMNKNRPFWRIDSFSVCVLALVMRVDIDLRLVLVARMRVMRERNANDATDSDNACQENHVLMNIRIRMGVKTPRREYWY